MHFLTILTFLIKGGNLSPSLRCSLSLPLFFFLHYLYPLSHTQHTHIHNKGFFWSSVFACTFSINLTYIYKEAFGHLKNINLFVIQLNWMGWNAYRLFENCQTFSGCFRAPNIKARITKNESAESLPNVICLVFDGGWLGKVRSNYFYFKIQHFRNNRFGALDLALGPRPNLLTVIESFSTTFNDFLECSCWNLF